MEEMGREEALRLERSIAQEEVSKSIIVRLV